MDNSNKKSLLSFHTGYPRADKPQGFGDRVPIAFQAANLSSKYIVNYAYASPQSRTGRFYDNTQPVPAYQINNSDISPAILKVLALPSFGEVTKELFALANEYGEYESTTGIFTFNNGATVIKNTNYWTDTEGNKHYFQHGYALYLTNENTTNHSPDTFYVPKSALNDILAYSG